ncbi:MAG: 2-ketoisovalerate ferredoxin oxidoreductase [Elusimicrobia bacterium RIFCSPHIGHO2_02_FULL_57_9]|nr:MAG: 2-ketoisovalerate ferredoxin oxidoreductase [Elusimicrobia bacterium RIFCSPHIGHO2_02_FULL_57_9]
MKPSIPAQETMTSGHVACQGCGSTISMRYALKGLGTNTVVVMPACCWTILAGAAPQSSLGVPILHSPFAAAAATACGVKAGLEAKGDKETQVMAWAGDGGTFDIGIQALSGAAERDEDIIYVCYDNEAYMNTGIQRSSATPAGAWTTTTPAQGGSPRPKKDLDAILRAHAIPYLATATPAYAEDMVRKFAKARRIRGFRFIHIYAPCPPGWKYDPGLTIELSRLSVQTGIFPLYEVEDGRLKINVPTPKRKPVGDFLRPQARFKRLSPEDEAAIQRETDRRWQALSQGS